MNDHRRQCEGVTLLEVLIVMMLISTATLGLLSLHQQMKAQSQLAAQWQNAEQLASVQLTRWRQQALTQGTKFAEQWQDGGQQQGVFFLHWKMTLPLGQDCYVVQLDVDWQDAQKLPHSLQFNMVYSRFGVDMMANQVSGGLN
ncbi:MAG: type IV pilus modification PilV family protein [Vibrio sp.]